MAYISENGRYRCRLQLDTQSNSPCIDVIEHYVWDAQRKCLDTSKPLGGLQVVFRADAWKILEDGSLDSERLELNMDNFGITIIKKKAEGEDTLTHTIAHLVEIFSLNSVEDLLCLTQVPPSKLLDAQFDCIVTSTVSKTNGKTYHNYRLVPVGWEGEKKAFSPAKSNNLDRFRAKLKVDCMGIKSNAKTAPTPTPTPTPTTPPPMPKKPVATLPSREEAEPIAWTVNDVWVAWGKTHHGSGDDVAASFYDSIEKMFGNADLESLTPQQLTTFAKAHNLPYADSESENLPF